MTEPTVREALTAAIHRDNPNLLWGEVQQVAKRLAPILEVALWKVGHDHGSWCLTKADSGVPISPDEFKAGQLGEFAVALRDTE